MVDLVNQITELALVPIHTLEATAHLKIVQLLVILMDPLDATMQVEHVLARMDIMVIDVNL